MADIVKMFTSGFWRYVVAWLLPCTAFLAGFLLTVYPSIRSFPILAKVDSATHSNPALGAFIFGGIAFGISALLALSYEPIYRAWEGYPWPRKLFIFGRNRELSRYTHLAREINSHVKRAKKAEEEDKLSLAAFSSNR